MSMVVTSMVTALGYGASARQKKPILVDPLPSCRARGRVVGSRVLDDFASIELTCVPFVIR
jgi:hypothetical protein